MSLLKTFRLTKGTICLLALAPFARSQVDVRPLWAVAEFGDRAGSVAGYGRDAAAAVAEAVERQGWIATLPTNDSPDARPAIDDGDATKRLGRRVLTDNVILGEVWVRGVASLPGAIRVQVGLRMLVYNAGYGVPVNGALAIRTVPVRSDEATAIREALAQAATAGVRTLFTQRLSRASVTETTNRPYRMDGGTRDGFRKGQRVVLSRGSITTYHGRIVRIGAHRADFVILNPVVFGLSPGDRVLGEYQPPTWPAAPRESTPPVWAVAGFGGTGDAALRQAASVGLIAALADEGPWSVVPFFEARHASMELGLKEPPTRLDAARLGGAVRARTVLVGEIVEHRVEQAGRGRKATVEIRVVAYDADTDDPVNGARVRQIILGKENDEALFWQAFRKASSKAARTLRERRPPPQARVVSTMNRFIAIDRGAKAGFRVGDEVVVIRGRVVLCHGRIASVRSDSAEFAAGRVLMGIAPGDRVSVVFDPAIIDKRR